MCHHLIASRAIAELGAIPPEGGLPPPDVPAGYKLPAFSVWIVEWAIRHIKETIPADWALLVEVPLAFEYARWNNSGHIDLVAIKPDGTEAIGMDYKTGRDPVDPAENNEQVGSYITLLKRAWETLCKVTFEIVQPRADEDEGFQRVSRVVVQDVEAGDDTDHSLYRLVSTLDRRVCAALDNALELNSGRTQCRWCPVGAQCPALQADLANMKLKLTNEAIAKVKKEPDDALLGDWIITARTLERPTKDAEEILHARLDSTQSIVAGNGTVISRKLQGGNYTIPDPVKFLAAVRTILPDEESIARTFRPRMGELKDEIARVKDIPKTSKQGNSAQAVFDGHLRPLVEQGEKRILVFS